MIKAGRVLLCLAALSGTPALAHHSFSMFDTQKLITVKGTVTDFVWKMPHVWVQLMVPTATGVQSWGFECHAPTLIERKGWNRNVLKSGDKVEILMHPMRDGSKAGSVIDVTLPSGQVIWNADTLTSP